MRMSKLFSQTLREAPSDAEALSHKLLTRAGFIRQLGTGIFSYLPLAKRSITKIENIMREEINAIGGQEITMPVVNPADIWKETGRWYQIGAELSRFRDRNEHDMVLAMTHEEVISDLVRKEVNSYRQLPALLYHIQTKWRDDPRPRAGLVRVREFTMLDSYSLDCDEEGLDRQYRAHYQAYFNIFRRCGLPVISVKSDVGMMGGSLAHEFMYLTPIGEDTLVLCDACKYRANRQVAKFSKKAKSRRKPKPLEKVATPNITTIESLAQFLDIEKAETAKAVFMVAKVSEGEKEVEKFAFAVVRGDMEVNETKIANALKANSLRPAHDEEIRAIGAVPGYASPIGLKGVLVVVDDLIPKSPNLVAGANEEGYHLLNVNYERDYRADIIADIVSAGDGDPCLECEAPLHTSRGVEVGNIFKLGIRYSQAMGCYYLDGNGRSNPVIMGSYGIGSGRLLACVAEEYNDEHGLIWPISIAPYIVHLVSLSGKEETVGGVADALYAKLQKSGIEVLYDDRAESAGVKFTDADLLGLPLRLTVSTRSMKQGGVEVKLRRNQEFSLVPMEDVISWVNAKISELKEEISKKVVPVPFDTESIGNNS